MPIAKYPAPKSYPIVEVLQPSGRRRVGFVFVGGTREQFLARVRIARKEASQLRMLAGPFIHATEGMIDF